MSKFTSTFTVGLQWNACPDVDAELISTNIANLRQTFASSLDNAFFSGSVADVPATKSSITVDSLVGLGSLHQRFADFGLTYPQTVYYLTSSFAPKLSAKTGEVVFCYLQAARYWLVHADNVRQFVDMCAEANIRAEDVRERWRE